MKLYTTHHDLGKFIAATLTPVFGEGRVFALRADPDTRLPLAVYRRTGYRPESDKDQRYTEEVSEQVAILSETYDEGVRLARQALRALSRLTERHDIEAITLDNSREETEEEGAIYVQILDLTFHITNI